MNKLISLSVILFLITVPLASAMPVIENVSVIEFFPKFNSNIGTIFPLNISTISFPLLPSIIIIQVSWPSFSPRKDS